MAIENETKSVRVNMKLNNGLDDVGNVKTVSISLGTLNKSAYDAQKVVNIVNLAVPCLAKSLVSTEKTEVITLREID